MRILSLLVVVGMMAFGVSACSDGNNGTGGSGGTGAAGGGDSGGSGGTAGTGGGNAGGGGGSGGGTSAGGYCGKSCAMPADCCPMGVPDCPSANYPNNWTCDSGACGAPQCATDMDCTFGGVLMGYGCLTISTNKACQKTCTTDADCDMLMLKCTGTDDNGMKYCSAPTMSSGCKADADCMGYGKCNTTSGACECSADGDCTGAGVDKCVK